MYVYEYNKKILNIANNNINQVSMHSNKALNVEFVGTDDSI